MLLKHLSLARNLCRSSILVLTMVLLSGASQTIAGQEYQAVMPINTDNAGWRASLAGEWDVWVFIDVFCIVLLAHLLCNRF